MNFSPVACSQPPRSITGPATPCDRAAPYADSIGPRFNSKCLVQVETGTVPFVPLQPIAERNTMKTIRFALLAILTFAGTASAFSAGSTFTATGVIEMLPTSMSDDASIVVGTGFFQV